MKKKISDLIKKKNKQKIVSLTAYSKNVASILDNHCDIILVGDSLGSVLYNYKSTREVTLSTMIEHSKSVNNMGEAMDSAGFGNCTNTGACEAECPKEISISNIIKLNKEYLKFH